MKNYALLLVLSFCLFSCSKNEKTATTPIAVDNFVRAADMSFLPEIESTNTIFYNSANVAESALSTLKQAGCNTIRIRLWKNPTYQFSGLEKVKAFATKARALGFKIWLTVHYSDTWADPGVQSKPEVWGNLNLSDLKLAVENYTSEVLTEINPDIYQIGNEINDGFLWPTGKLSTNENQCIDLLKVASAKIRAQSPKTKIMLHYAGINTGTNSGASWFFNKVKDVDYDYIGLSYYPMWHGKVMADIKTTINTLGATYNKKVLIAETSYPFTFGYNDYTNNIIGSVDQIISDYPASSLGQKEYLLALKGTIKSSSYGIGFAYWGTEWIAFKGNQATDGSSYENQALWDFNNRVLPAIEAFKND